MGVSQALTMAEGVVKTASVFDLQVSDAAKQVVTLRTMIQHASAGSDLSQNFHAICEFGLGSEHRGVRVLSYHLLYLIDVTDDAQYQSLIPHLQKHLTLPFSPSNNKIRVCALNMLANLPLAVFQQVAGAVGPAAIATSLDTSVPSIVREACVNAIAHAVLNDRPFNLCAQGPLAAEPLRKLHAVAASTFQLTCASWLAIKDAMADRDPHVSFAAFHAARTLILDSCQRQGHMPWQLLSEPYLMLTLPPPLQHLAATAPAELDLLMARMCALSADMQWVAILPVCFMVMYTDTTSPLGSASTSTSNSSSPAPQPDAAGADASIDSHHVTEAHTDLADFAHLAVSRRVVQLCQSVLQPLLYATDPALVFEVGTALAAMKGIGLVPAQDIAMSFLKLMNRQDLQHASIDIIQHILSLLPHIPIAQQVGLIQNLLMSISRFASQEMRIDAFVIVFRDWLAFILDQLEVVCVGCVSLPPEERIRVLQRSYEVRALSHLWEEKWVTEVWQQDDDSNKLREEMLVCVVECVCAVQSDNCDPLAWSCLCWEVS
eukprot:c7448_g1_i1.p1 GENE.c7448_g1_i1~~c7448_g1_i1.p1  ORF type:complete len:546 (-),score=147.17 c7448_g1_i1:72-1709(-)